MCREAEFEARRAAGEFALHWGAHGLFYGIPWDQLAPMKEGHDVLANLSRSMLYEAARVTGALHVLWITARPEVLAARLAGRGRESAEEIARRLARKAPEPPADLKVSVIDNSGALADAVAAAPAPPFSQRGCSDATGGTAHPQPSPRRPRLSIR